MSYDAQYFGDARTFAHDYGAVAEAIVRAYAPERVLDVGCGPGHLSRELARRGCSVVATDGYSSPDFSGTRVLFEHLDLESEQAVRAATSRFTNAFDLAVCLEVGEHIREDRSDALVALLCSAAPAVVFSAAVPGQPGEGHVNCQPRTWWHDKFSERGLSLQHRVRPSLMGNARLPPWFRFNVLDYGSAPPGPGADLTRSLLDAESKVTSAYFGEYELRFGLPEALADAERRLQMPAVKFILRLQRGVGRLFSIRSWR
ncbi:class I SAM-dependent methyltransferase [Ramlibacter sp. PS4R-6]|uniref:class I SAM-dependent methyltransferase n=1 Tax=Ramlibacter sp. PS4R-6 TaxID=3133438 RepID=UPI00309C70CD